MAVQPISFNRVTSLPSIPDPGGLYFLQQTPTSMSIVVAGNDGVYRYEAPPKLQIVFGFKGNPAAGKELGRYLVVETIDWQALASAAKSEVAATAQADFLVKNGATTVAWFRWGAGSTVATVTVLSPTSSPGDVLIVTAPAVQDATLSGITGVLLGLRRP